MSDALPKPGWYADPENPASERWWNGSGWSEQKRPASVAPETPGPAPAGPPAAAPIVPPPVFPAPPAAPAAPGFTYGVAAGADARPDPYAPPPPNPGQPYYGAVQPYGARPPSSTNGFALAGLLVSSFGWVVASVLGPIVGIVLSIVGLSQATKREQQGLPSGRGLAIAGIAVGGGLLLIVGLFLVAVFATFPRYP